MKENVKPILVLDMGINAMNVVNYLRNAFPYDEIYYLNDLKCSNYEGKEVEEIEKKIKELCERIKKYNPKLIVLASDTITEYGKDIVNSLAKELKISVVSLVDEVCNEIKNNYDSKDMAFLAPFGIIESNIFQKNFVYARLYNLNADNMADTLSKMTTKTAESFEQVKQTILPIYKKAVDVIIPTLPNVLLYKTEIFEYARSTAELLDINELVVKKTKQVLKKIANTNTKKVKYVYIITTLENSKSANMNKIYSKILSVPYKFITEEAKIEKEEVKPSIIHEQIAE